MKVRIAPSAQRDLRSIHAYISRDNPTAADRVAKAIAQVIHRLGAFPSIGKEGSTTATRESLVARTPYVVVYEVYDSVIRVIRVLHGAMQWPPSDDE